MSKPVDYDAPRRPAVEFGDDGLDGLGTRNSAARSPTADVDDVETAEPFDLPGADLPDDELTGTVLPMQPDEFRCTRCYLVHHRSQLASQHGADSICQECA